MAVWYNRAALFIGAAILVLAIGGCTSTSEKVDVEKASFSSWKVSAWPRSIIFNSVGTPSRRLIYNGIYVPVYGISVEVLPELLPGTALVSIWEKCYKNGSRVLELCDFSRATLFVSSQKEADAWNRYFAELLVESAEKERKMREEFAPKKINPPPTLQKSD